MDFGESLFTCTSYDSGGSNLVGESMIHRLDKPERYEKSHSTEAFGIHYFTSRQTNNNSIYPRSTSPASQPSCPPSSPSTPSSQPQFSSSSIPSASSAPNANPSPPKSATSSSPPSPSSSISSTPIFASTSIPNQTASCSFS